MPRCSPNATACVFNRAFNSLATKHEFANRSCLALGKMLSAFSEGITAPRGSSIPLSHHGPTCYTMANSRLAEQRGPCYSTMKRLGTVPSGPNTEAHRCLPEVHPSLFTDIVPQPSPWSASSPPFSCADPPALTSPSNFPLSSQQGLLKPLARHGCQDTAQIP